MPRMKINILRDVGKNPSIVEITRNGRTVKAIYDGDNLILDGPISHLPSISEALRIAYPYEIEAASRPEWYDRNPATRNIFSYLKAEGPHAATLQNSITCGEDRKAVLQNLQLSVIRVTAAAPVGSQTYIRAYYHFYEGLANQPTFFVDCGPGNNAGDRGDLFLSECLFMNAGDAIDFYTGDDSTGGTVTYIISGMLTEFDA